MIVIDCGLRCVTPGRPCGPVVIIPLIRKLSATNALLLKQLMLHVGSSRHAMGLAVGCHSLKTDVCSSRGVPHNMPRPHAALNLRVILLLAAVPALTSPRPRPPSSAICMRAARAASCTSPRARPRPTPTPPPAPTLPTRTARRLTPACAPRPRSARWRPRTALTPRCVHPPAWACGGAAVIRATIQQNCVFDVCAIALHVQIRSWLMHAATKISGLSHPRLGIRICAEHQLN